MGGHRAPCAPFSLLEVKESRLSPARRTPSCIVRRPRPRARAAGIGPPPALQPPAPSVRLRLSIPGGTKPTEAPGGGPEGEAAALVAGGCPVPRKKFRGWKDRASPRLTRLHPPGPCARPQPRICLENGTEPCAPRSLSFPSCKTAPPQGPRMAEVQKSEPGVSGGLGQPPLPPRPRLLRGQKLSEVDDPEKHPGADPWERLVPGHQLFDLPSHLDDKPDKPVKSGKPSWRKRHWSCREQPPSRGGSGGGHPSGWAAGAAKARPRLGGGGGGTQMPGRSLTRTLT